MSSGTSEIHHNNRSVVSNNQDEFLTMPITDHTTPPEVIDDDDDDDDAISVARSIASTALATEVGSTVVSPKDAFLRSITFFKPKILRSSDGDELLLGADEIQENYWDIQLKDLSIPKKKKDSNHGIVVASIGGIIRHSFIQPGDRLKSINGKKIGPSYNAQRAREYMDKQYEKQGVLSIAVGNKDGNDVLIQVTVIKPKSNMTYKELGVTVWFWGVLCVKEIKPDSIFKHTVLKETDHILSINNIDCSDMDVESFVHIINNLPLEITIVLKRGKERWTGKFG